MTDKVKSGSKKNKTDLTTAQISAIIKVSKYSLYVYTKNFSEFFSPGACKHTVGRLWTIADLELVQSLRSLYRERVGTDGIRELLATGWKLEHVQVWTRELVSLLVDRTLEAQEEAKDSAGEVITLKRILEELKHNDREFKAMWIQLQDLQHEWIVMQKAWRLRTVITKAVKKKYHGKLPELYPQE